MRYDTARRDFWQGKILTGKEMVLPSAVKTKRHGYVITSDPLTQFAVVFSAVIHDVDHPGVPNAQLVKEKTRNAEIYKKSVAEQNSVELAWDLLMSHEYSALRACIYQTESDLRRFRQLVVNTVMATVMATDIADKEDEIKDRSCEDEKKDLFFEGEKNDPFFEEEKNDPSCEEENSDSSCEEENNDPSPNEDKNNNSEKTNSAVDENLHDSFRIAYHRGNTSFVFHIPNDCEDGLRLAFGNSSITVSKRSSEEGN
eukprot:scaffold667_cov117-Cylindrotheca_fusiformis.AAC.12